MFRAFSNISRHAERKEVRVDKESVAIYFLLTTQILKFMSAMEYITTTSRMNNYIITNGTVLPHTTLQIMFTTIMSLYFEYNKIKPT